MAENIFPTNYTEKAIPDWTDVVWSSDAVINFNLTVASIALYTLTNADTDDLSEWTTNLYASETNLWNSTIIQAKQDVSNLSSDMVADVWSTTKYPSVLATQNAIDNYSLPDATETVKGKDRLSTPDEACVGTLATTIMTPKNVNDFYWVSMIAWTDYTSASSTAVKATTSATLILLKEIEINTAWSYTVSYSASSSITWGVSSDRTNQSQIYKNGVALWTLHTNTAEFGSGITYIESFTFATWDLVQIYWAYTWVSSYEIHVTGYYIKYSISSFNKYDWTVNLD